MNRSCAALVYALAPLLGVFFTTLNLLLIFFNPPSHSIHCALKYKPSLYIQWITALRLIVVCSNNALGSSGVLDPTWMVWSTASVMAQLPHWSFVIYLYSYLFIINRQLIFFKTLGLVQD